MKAGILLVDDEEVVLLTLKRILESQGFAVTVASGGAKALEISKAQPFDLVIMDIRMPGLDGLEVLKSSTWWKSPSSSYPDRFWSYLRRLPI